MAKGNSTRGGRPATVCQERRIKVYQAHYDYRSKEDANPYSLNRAVPWVQLKGLWLEAAGFAINTAVHVRVMHGCLVLTTLARKDEGQPMTMLKNKG